MAARLLRVLGGVLWGCASFWLGAAQAGVQAKGQEIALQAGQVQALGVRLMALQEGAQALAVSYPAQVLVPPQQELVLTAPVTGLVTQVLVQSGQRVRAGAPLLRLQSPDLGQMQMQYLQAASRARLADETARREVALFGEGIIPARRVAEARAAREEAAAALAQTASALRLAGIGRAELREVERTGRLQDGVTLRATRTGVVLALEARIGQRVAPADPLLRLADLRRLWLGIEVPLEVSAHWQPGTEVTVQGQALKARILRMAPQGNMASQSVLVTAELPADAPLRPGAFVQVALPGAEQKGWNLPLAAVIREGSAAYVFVRNAQGFAVRPVHIIAASAQEVRVQGDLRAGDQVAVAGVVALKGAWQESRGGK
ncbi:efflux RND transporter periplasmic adaptor subunit [Acidithiobacillus sp.]|uniref:efflux RND transporter periplasmic adaptor subunit n=2 Tax=Acidithiobacillus sp. TaxID=1872118 RepID=UPI003D0252FB